MDIKDIQNCLNTSDNNITKEFYEPCLNWADSYDRGVGYFTSGWIAENAKGLANLISRGGKLRWITSPILEHHDYEAFQSLQTEIQKKEFVESKIASSIDELAHNLEKETMDTLAWMVHDGIVEFRFAITDCSLDGDFHDKFGIFRKGDENIAFVSSMNDSKKGFRNYENFTVFKSWENQESYITYNQKRFDKIWNGLDRNLTVYNLSEAMQERIFRLRKSEERPYTRPTVEKNNKWAHQDKAVELFLEKKNGILAMATGTGKTVTALKIVRRLIDEKKIKRAIITMFGNDLLDQWAGQLRTIKGLRLYRHYESYKDASDFFNRPDNAILLINRDAALLQKVITTLNNQPGEYDKDTLWIFDEVHGLGSEGLATKLSGKFQPFVYRLGLSATPTREYDDVGNQFIKNEVGKQIFEFGLEDAIKKGILCEMNYEYFPFFLTDDEKAKKRSYIKRFEYEKSQGLKPDEKKLFMDLARVNKTSVSKLPIFKDLIEKNPDILKQCIIFVETMEYGKEVQKIAMNVNPNYHTYYADDEKENLIVFANNGLNYLITCKKISEGIDIKSVKNIILFSSDRARLVTTQRIGRALRINPNEPDKQASVIDFICQDTNNNAEESADTARQKWLTDLAKIRRDENE